MTEERILIIDEDDYTWSVLGADLSQRGYRNLARIKSGIELPLELKASIPDVVIFNYHYHQPDSVVHCNVIKAMVPTASVIAIVAAGPAIKAVRAWVKQTNCIDVIIEKPLSDERFFITLQEIFNNKLTAKTMSRRASLLEKLLPEAAVSVLDNEYIDNQEAELIEAAVLFTDIRKSSEAIARLPPREFFETLNMILSNQASMIREHQGSIVKYTGDGLMAIFRGMGRSHLALRSAIKLAESSFASPLPFGVGVSEGLVMAGFVGDANNAGQRRQFDVIGANVHLASRLCSMAESGEVIATRQLHQAARLQEPSSRQIGQVSVRGFERGVDCVAFSHISKTN